MSRRVLLLTNVPAPYRIPVFEALGEMVELSVFFCQADDPDRLWEVDTESERVAYRALAASMIDLGGRLQMVRNPELSGLLSESPYDFYLAGENFLNAPSVLTTWRAARRRDRPFLLWSESVDTPFASGTLPSNLYRRWLYARTDAFLAYGEMAQRFLERRGAPSERIVRGLQVVPPAQIPPPKTIDEPLPGLAPAGGATILFVGYLTERKGVGDLIDAFAMVAGKDDRLLVLGSGPAAESLEMRAANDPRILFPGYVDTQLRSDYLHAADLLVLPTLHDPWGLVVNEAMACGLPVIVSDAAGASELIDGNGVVVPAGEPAALARALETLTSSPEVRARMGRRSRAIIANYTVERAAHAFVEALDLAERMRAAP